MAHVAPKSNSTPRKTLPPGSYVARCYQMIQLGTQEEEYMGQKKSTPKIWLGWEFPTELDVFVEEKGEQPYTMGKEYSFYMNDKANFRKDLESWRGKKFTDDQAGAFDAEALLGKPCLINVQSYTKKNGEESVKVGAITPLVKAMICPELINDLQSLSLDEAFSRIVFDALPKFLRERIEKSPEYQAINQPKYQAPASNAQLVDALFDESEEPPF